MGVNIVAIYARKSNDQGGVSDEAKSVTRQIEHARAYAVRKGWTVAGDHIYVDDGISGAEFATRPGFLPLMNAVAAKPRPAFDVIVMSEDSRLGREAIETAYALKQIIQAGVRVFFYLGDRERTLDSPTEKLLMSVAAFADELERERARQRTYDAMRRQAEAGYVTGGRVFGYDNVEVAAAGPDGRSQRSHVARQVNEIEAGIVRRIFGAYAAGHGFTTIAKGLNDEAAPCPRAQQGRPHGWAPSSVREILHRPLYRGQIVWNKTRKRDSWGRKKPSARSRTEYLEVSAPSLRVVTDELWTAVQARLAEMCGLALRSTSGRLMGRPPRTGAKYLLSGLLRCAQCGSTLEARSRSHGRQRALFYGCAAYHKRGRAVCTNGLTVPMDDFDFAVLAALEDQILQPEILDAALDRATAELMTDSTVQRRERLEQDLARLEREVSRFTAALGAGGDLETIVAALREREAERAVLQRDLAELAGGVTPDQLSAPSLRAELRQILTDWRSLLRQQVAQGHQIVRRLIVGRLDCAPQPERFYRVSGTGTIARIIEGHVPLMVASPNYASWNQMAGWLCAVDGLRCAA